MTGKSDYYFWNLECLNPAFQKRCVDPRYARAMAKDRKSGRKVYQFSTSQGRRGQE